MPKYNKTNIEEVRKKNAESGMSYNEAKAYIARTTGGYNTRQFSNTDIDQVRKEIHEES